MYTHMNKDHMDTKYVFSSSHTSIKTFMDITHRTSPPYVPSII